MVHDCRRSEQKVGKGARTVQTDVFLRARPVIESLYEDTCTVYRSGTATNGARTSIVWTAVCEGIPCRLSFSSLSANAADNADKVAQSAKLFVYPSADICEGDRIVVRRVTGDVSAWERSGLPAVYPTHKEIMLTPMEVHA